MHTHDRDRDRNFELYRQWPDLRKVIFVTPDFMKVDLFWRN
jgi:hypothetical protein